MFKREESNAFYSDVVSVKTDPDNEFFYMSYPESLTTTIPAYLEVGKDVAIEQLLEDQDDK